MELPVRVTRPKGAPVDLLQQINALHMPDNDFDPQINSSSDVILYGGQ
jgi:hypothetical protein